MIVIIPLGGIGDRFKKNSYNEPKALIKVLGKPIIFYLLENLNLNNIDFVYIPYNKEYYNFRLEDLLRKNFPNINFKFLKLENNTEGALHTILISLNQLNIEDCPVLSLDGDNFYTTDIINKWNGENKVFVFEDKNLEKLPIYSYVKVDNNNVTDIIEKQIISDYCCTGCYGFKSFKELEKYSNCIIENKEKQKNEYYISGVIKKMINSEINFTIEKINKKEWICLGTPIQVRLFCNNYPKISCNLNKQVIQNIRICFDLDNTLVTYPKVKGDYSTVEPIMNNINYLKYLKKFGNVIIIYTARRMKSYNGNIGKVNSNIGKLTFDTLDKFNIPYDEIYFGKPYADVYIDDLAVNCFDNLEKKLGFYYDKISPRDFNFVDLNSLNTVTKSGKDLSGEIYYYKNIPVNQKDLFPIFLKNNDSNYTVEKIYGIPCITLYLDGLLNETILKNIMNSIKRIQDEKIPENEKNINIYENYSKKIISRYQNYDYSKFNNSHNIYINLISELEEYENKDLGKKKIIHGDTVLSNILINEHSKLKFIDMRGKVGNNLSICGDWLYDWAKLFQSLIGYDEILENKYIDKKYKSNIIKTFEKYFCELYSKNDFINVLMITKSLLFSLIPLHNNNKCYDYFNLINFVSNYAIE
jgi:capsule biosynthesis phosphatase